MHTDSEMLLLGAGASVEAGVPAAILMTKRMLEHFETADFMGADRYSRALAFVVGGLMFGEARKGNNPYATGINVEAVFNAVDLLAKRNTLEAAPFIGSWDANVELLDQIDPSDRDADFFLRELMLQVQTQIMPAVRDSVSGRYGMPTSHAVPVSLHDSFIEAVNRAPRPGNGNLFEGIKRRMLAALTEMVLLERGTDLSYLKPLFEQPKPLVIASLNYDNAIEEAADQNGWQWTDFLDDWNEKGKISTDFLNANTVHLIKLHGSILWQRSVSGVKNSKSVFSTTEFVRRQPDGQDPYSHTRYSPGVIFGGVNKLTPEGPYLDLLRAFSDHLSHAQRLTVVGYSFCDFHINVQIVRWLERNPNSIMRIIDPHFSRIRHDFADQLRFFSQQTARVQVMEIPKGLSDAEYDKQIKTFTGDRLRELFSPA